MEDIDKLHEFYERRDVSQAKLQKIALYIENYLNILLRHYDIETTNEELEEASVKLYQTLLHQSKSMSMELNQDAEDILNGTLKDFESEDTSDAYGNMMALVGKAGTIEELRHPKITQLGVEMAKEQEERM